MSHLIPEVRVNKNGVPVIKHVLADKPEAGAARSIPSPPLPAIHEPQNELPDYDATIQQNRDYERRSDSVLMSPVDFAAFSDLLEYAAKTNDDGDDRVWYTGQLIKFGNVGAAKTIARYIEDQHDSNSESHDSVFDAWSYGAAAGVFEQGKDYTATAEDMEYFTFVTRVLELSLHDVTISEVDNEDFQTIASIHSATGGKADSEDVAIFWEERGGIDVDSYLEYLGTHNATRDGVL
jgi:hypothetical protein